MKATVIIATLGILYAGATTIIAGEKAAATTIKSIQPITAVYIVIGVELACAYPAVAPDLDLATYADLNPNTQKEPAPLEEIDPTVFEPFALVKADRHTGMLTVEQ
jgi:predicted component of type VI protein secretion system